MLSCSRPNICSGWLRGLSCAVALCLCTANPVQQGGKPQLQPGQISQDVKYIWPSALSEEPAVFPGDTFAAELAKIGHSQYDKFVKEMLPLDLKSDAKFAKDFTSGDSGRTNKAFNRWQKKVWSHFRKIPISEIDWDGKEIKRTKGVPYKWPELYQSKAWNEMESRVMMWVSSYFRRLRLLRDGESRGRPPYMKVFPWFEVYKAGEWAEPQAHTGAPACGLICLTCGRGAGQQNIVFIDHRGKTAPFGRTHEMPMHQGQLFLFPSFLEHYVKPHRGNETNVVIRFLAWYEGGAPDFDWEDDRLGDYTYEKSYAIKATKRGDIPGRIANDHDEL